MWGLSIEEFSLVIAAIVLGSIMFVTGIGLFVIWIKYSWIERNNSQNMTGADLAHSTFEREGMQGVEIRSTWFMIKYWNFGRGRRGRNGNTFKLRPITHDRRSIWTMMEAAQQTYVATLHKTKKYFIVFRIPFILNLIGTIGTAALIILYFRTSHNSFPLWVLGVSLSALTVASSIGELIKISILKKQVVPMLEKSGLNANELKKIQRIFNWRYVYAIANAIYQIVILVLRIISKSNSNNK